MDSTEVNLFKIEDSMKYTILAVFGGGGVGIGRRSPFTFKSEKIYGWIVMNEGMIG